MSLDSLVAKVNKKLGDGTLVRGSDLKDLTIHRMTTGSIALDLALGGGWPLNCWCEIVGEPSNGKSVIALKTIAAAQAIHTGHTTLWIAAEDFIPEWAQACGVNLDNVIIANTRVMEDAYQVIVDTLDARLVDAVVVDSLSALVPNDENEKAMDEWQVGLGARLTGKFMKKSSTAQRRSMTEPDRDCLGIIISQWREKVGVMYGDNRVTPYGRAKEFHYMVRLEVRRDDWIERGNERKVGLTFKGRTIKNKTAPPQKLGVVDFYWEDAEPHHAGDYDMPKQLANIGMDLDIVERRGAYFRYRGEQWQGKETFQAAVGSDAVLQASLDADIRAAVLKVPVPVPETKRSRRLKKTT